MNLFVAKVLIVGALLTAAVIIAAIGLAILLLRLVIRANRAFTAWIRAPFDRHAAVAIALTEAPDGLLYPHRRLPGPDDAVIAAYEAELNFPLSDSYLGPEDYPC